MLDLIATIIENMQQMIIGEVKVVHNNMKAYEFITETHERSNEFTQDAVAEIEAIIQLLEKSKILIVAEYRKLRKSKNVTFNEDAELYLLKQCNAEVVKQREEQQYI